MLIALKNLWKVKKKDVWNIDVRWRDHKYLSGSVSKMFKSMPLENKRKYWKSKIKIKNKYINKRGVSEGIRPTSCVRAYFRRKNILIFYFWILFSVFSFFLLFFLMFDVCDIFISFFARTFHMEIPTRITAPSHKKNEIFKCSISVEIFQAIE